MSKWVENLRASLIRYPVVILHGNVRDIYVDADGRLYENLTSLLEMISRNLPVGFDEFVHYDPVSGERRMKPLPADQVQSATSDELAGTAPREHSRGERAEPVRIFAKWSEALREGRRNHFVVFSYLDKCVAYRRTYDDTEMERVVWLDKVIENISPNNRLVMVALQDSMVPTELYVNSPNSTLFAVPPASEADRSALLCRRGKRLDDANRSLLTGLTEGMLLTHISDLAKELPELGEKPNRFELKRLVNKYRVGEREDYWGNLSIKRIRDAYEFFVEEEGVRGQDEAVAKVIDSLCLARAGLVGLASGATARPKGALFFAGPTGVGKTMMAKKLAKFLFASEQAFIRFDMSEFKEDHTVSKLLGSPPGYVGFEEGGMLTNAVRDRPFSVVLFDEIEKAHPKILDVFLQILDDGRVTDSHGQTVFFSETMIIFTSNIGARSSTADGFAIDEQAELSRIMEDDLLPLAERKSQVRAHFIDAVERFFVNELSRPELLNRIGNRIVPFNPVISQDVQRAIMLSNLQRVKTEIEQRHHKQQYRVDFKDELADYLVNRHSAKLAKYGGRGSINVLEDEVMIPMAQQMLEAEFESEAGVTFHCSLDLERDRIRVLREFSA